MNSLRFPNFQCHSFLSKFEHKMFKFFVFHFQDLPTFITEVVNQLATNIKRIKDLGVRKVAVGAIQPVGCLPSNTITDSFQQCNTTFNTLAMVHNQLLQKAVANYNNESNSMDFTILDLFSVFSTVLQNNGN